MKCNTVLAYRLNVKERLVHLLVWYDPMHEVDDLFLVTVQEVGQRHYNGGT